MSHPGAYGGRCGLARALSKLGWCSRTGAAALVAAGRVAVDGRIERDPERTVLPGRTAILVDGRPVMAAPRVYVALNKPRGLVTSAADDRGRDTVYRCLADAALPWVGPVGRLDRASEGLLLLTNDTAWAAHLTDPAGGVVKRYHVQVGRVPDGTLASRLEQGVEDRGESLSAVRARVLRAGARHGWLEVELDEGRNRQIRRMLAALGVGVLRLVRVAIGPLALGGLPKGGWRLLDPAEVLALAPPSNRPMAGRTGLG